MYIVEPHLPRRGVARRRQRVAGDGRPVAGLRLAGRRDGAARVRASPPLRPRDVVIRHTGLFTPLF